jgi:hypothetical protein
MGLTKLQKRNMMRTPTYPISVNTRINYRWLEILQKRQIHYILLDPIHDRLFIEQLQTSPDWIIDFASEGAVIFMRRERSFNNIGQR